MDRRRRARPPGFERPTGTAAARTPIHGTSHSVARFADRIRRPRFGWLISGRATARQPGSVRTHDNQDRRRRRHRASATKRKEERYVHKRGG
jgi:hypothetical protein